MKFVLVHGAWHYGELWNPVREHLEASGHEVHTPTAGGLGVFRLTGMTGSHEVLLTDPEYTARKFIEAGRD